MDMRPPTRSRSLPARSKELAASSPEALDPGQSPGSPSYFGDLPIAPTASASMDGPGDPPGSAAYLGRSAADGGSSLAMASIGLSNDAGTALGPRPTLGASENQVKPMPVSVGVPPGSQAYFGAEAEIATGAGRHVASSPGPAKSEAPGSPAYYGQAAIGR